MVNDGLKNVMVVGLHEWLGLLSMETRVAMNHGLCMDVDGMDGQ